MESDVGAPGDNDGDLDEGEHQHGADAGPHGNVERARGTGIHAGSKRCWRHRQRKRRVVQGEKDGPGQGPKVMQPASSCKSARMRCKSEIRHILYAKYQDVARCLAA